MEKLKVAILGGSFDPPHFGHLMIISTVLSEGYDKLLVIPTGNHPFGKKNTDFRHRFEMLKAAVAIFDKQKVEVSDIENRKDVTSRTYDTVMQLKKSYPKADFTLIIGEDNASELSSWYKWEKLQKEVKTEIFGRNNYTSDNVAFKLPDISSTSVRTAVLNNKNISNMVPDAVIRYIKENNLYTQSDESRFLKWGLVGTGKVGMSLFNSMSAAGNPPLWVSDIQPAGENLPNFINYNELTSKHFESAELVVYATSDRHYPEPELPENSPFLFHTGGMLASTDRFKLLNGQSNRNKTGIIHPLLAVFSQNTDLRHKVFGLEGNSEAKNIAKQFLAPLSPEFLEIESSLMPLYHAFAAVSANGTAYLNTVMSDLLKEITGDSEVSKQSVLQLMRTSLDGTASYGNKGITGALAREDWETLILHIDALEKSELPLTEHIKTIYKQLLTAVISLKNKEIPDKLKDKLGI